MRHPATVLRAHPSAMLLGLTICCAGRLTHGAANLQPISKVAVVSASKHHTATVIWLHGLGERGKDWSGTAHHLKASFKHVRWLFPTAQLRAITAHPGHKVPAWFDFTSYKLRHDDLGFVEEDHDGLRVISLVVSVVGASGGVCTTSVFIHSVAFSCICVMFFLPCRQAHEFCRHWWKKKSQMELVGARIGKYKSHALARSLGGPTYIAAQSPGADRIVIGGFSQGAAVALNLVCQPTLSVPIYGTSSHGESFSWWYAAGLQGSRLWWRACRCFVLATHPPPTHHARDGQFVRDNLMHRHACRTSGVVTVAGWVPRTGNCATPSRVNSTSNRVEKQRNQTIYLSYQCVIPC
jgi:hypothetical protein